MLKNKNSLKIVCMVLNCDKNELFQRKLNADRHIRKTVGDMQYLVVPLVLIQKNLGLPFKVDL